MIHQHKLQRLCQWRSRIRSRKGEEKTKVGDIKCRSKNVTTNQGSGLWQWYRRSKPSFENRVQWNSSVILPRLIKRAALVGSRQDCKMSWHVTSDTTWLETGCLVCCEFADACHPLSALAKWFGVRFSIQSVEMSKFDFNGVQLSLWSSEIQSLRSLNVHAAWRSWKDATTES